MAIQDLNTLSRVIIAKHADEDSDYIEEEGNIEEESIEELAEEEGEEEIGPKRKKISEEEDSEDSE